MTEKIKVAVFDKDLKIRRYGLFPLSADGNKIKIVSGGEGHFMPEFDRSSYLEFPQRSLIPPFRMQFERVYFVRNHAKRCVNFDTEEVSSLDPDTVKEFAENTLLRGIGHDKQEVPYIFYLLLLIMLAVAAKVFGVIV